MIILQCVISTLLCKKKKENVIEPKMTHPSRCVCNIQWGYVHFLAEIVTWCKLQTWKVFLLRCGRYNVFNILLEDQRLSFSSVWDQKSLCA